MFGYDLAGVLIVVMNYKLGSIGHKLRWAFREADCIVRASISFNIRELVSKKLEGRIVDETFIPDIPKVIGIHLSRKPNLFRPWI